MTPEVIAALLNAGMGGAVILAFYFNNKWNAAREARQQEADEKRDKKWQEFFTLLSSGTKSDVDEMRITAEHLTKSLDSLVSLYSIHDTRAQTILAAIELIKADIAKLLGKTAGD